MFKPLMITASSLGLLALGACTTTGNVERNAAAGAVIGGVAGAVIGNNTGSGDAGDGAAIGAVIGGAAGAYKGYRDDKDQELRKGQSQSYKLDKATKYYDDATGRYYYREVGSNRTFYENGERRS